MRDEEYMAPVDVRLSRLPKIEGELCRLKEQYGLLPLQNCDLHQSHTSRSRMESPCGMLMRNNC